jgi:alpha-L-fucosidase
MATFRLRWLVTCLVAGLAGSAGAVPDLPVADGPFKPSWESLAQYQCPEWFRDAKFGIWAHWGAQCQPEQGDWYARNMYMQGSAQNKYHVEHYGHPSKFGFKDICNIWKADKFDPERLVGLYKKAGAQYFVMMANHHCNFDNWNSKHQPWNSVAIGPKKDLVGLWEKAARAAGLRFGVTVHAGRAWQWYEVAQGSDSTGPMAGVKYDGVLTKADGKGLWWEGLDPQDLYAQNHKPGEKPDAAYGEKFYSRVIDLIDSYKPDLLYFDDGVLPLRGVDEAYGLGIAAHLYNSSASWHGGRNEAVMNTKGLNDQQRKCLVWDIERGVSGRVEPFVWQTDTCIGGWHYSRPLYDRHGYKSVTQVVQMLLDIVSKNGNLLLNIPVRGDGTIDEDEEKFLEGMAEWMAVNGECVFGTRPWKIFGEGPAAAEKAEAGRHGGQADVRKKPYTAEDYRFTTKGDALYAVAMAWPEDGKLVVRCLASGAPGIQGDISGVEMLGAGKVAFERTADGLAVTLPEKKPCAHAFALKITGLDLAVSEPVMPKVRYEPTLESLSQHDPAPEWFRDAKYGIYFHWGVYSVPAFGNEWYPCNMFRTNSAEYRHHVETYGDPAKFGYTDFIPMFKAEKFNADDWADLFAKSGAKFAGPVAEHHDNFSMWDSKVHPWNAAAMGPKRDLTGELEKAIRARGMKFITTFHHEKCGIWEPEPGKVLGHYAAVKQNFPQILKDRKLAEFYGDVPREKYLKLWKAKLVEVIDKYKPDLIWHDAWMDEIPTEDVYAYLAHYFNAASEWGRDVVVTVKGLDLPRELAVEDFEKGRADKLTPHPWLTDDTISKGSWCYTKDLQIKDPDEVIDTFIDIVSKNGQLLLNISPMADGTIPQEQRDVLLAMGAWLKTNGEAIYATRPWSVYGEGPTRMKKGGHFVGEIRYGAKDIRFTQSKDGRALYAVALGVPEDGKLLVRSLASHDDGSGRIGSVALLGSNLNVEWKQTERGLEVGLPGALPSEYALALKITGDGLTPVKVEEPLPVIRADKDGAFTLGAADAQTHGAVAVEEHGGKPNLGFWDDPKDWVSWRISMEKPGAFEVKAEVAAMADGVECVVEAAGASTTCRVPATGAWDRFATVDAGRIEIAKAGDLEVKVRPKDAKTWKAINLRSITLRPLK